MKTEAIAYYHSLLNDQSAVETHELLFKLSKERNLFFGDRPLCIVLRPHFYTEDQFDYLKQETETILGAFSKVHQACIADASLRKQFWLEPWEEEMIMGDKDSAIPWPTSRLDSFYSHEHNTLQFIEYNAETPAGMGYEDMLAKAFSELPIMKRFRERFNVRPLPVREQLLDALLRAYNGWRGNKSAVVPQIGIVDWEDVPTRAEHYLCKDWFEANGVKAVLADPAKLEYRKGKLWSGDFRIDLIYKRVLGSELFERLGMKNPIFDALREHNVCIANSFQALLLYKKCSLAFLSDVANHPLFNAAEVKAIHDHIPWTRHVVDKKTKYGNQDIDLLPFIADNRERLVLKPNDSYGGKGVVLGWDTSPEDWTKALKEASNNPYIVQEKVNVASEVFPFYQDNQLRLNRVYVDADPFIFWGQTVGGVLTRLSSAALLNVTAGHGSAVPTFLIERK